MVFKHVDRARGPRELPQFVKDASFRPELETDVLPETGAPLYENPTEVERAMANLSTHKDQFCVNSGMLVYVAENGEPWCVPLSAFEKIVTEFRGGVNPHRHNPMTEYLNQRLLDRYGERGSKIIDALKEAGYVYSDFTVPHAHDSAWRNRKARELSLKEDPGEVLPLKDILPLPKLMEVGELTEKPVTDTEAAILEGIRFHWVERMEGVRLNMLETPPEFIKFPEPAEEERQLREVLAGETHATLNDPEANDVTKNLLLQLVFYKQHLNPHLKTRIGAVEVVTRRESEGDKGVVEKFVLHKEGSITKVTGVLEEGHLSIRIARLTKKRNLSMDLDTKL